MTDLIVTLGASLVSGVVGASLALVVDRWGPDATVAKQAVRLSRICSGS